MFTNAERVEKYTHLNLISVSDLVQTKYQSILFMQFVMVIRCNASHSVLFEMVTKILLRFGDCFFRLKHYWSQPFFLCFCSLRQCFLWMFYSSFSFLWDWIKSFIGHGWWVQYLPYLYSRLPVMSCLARYAIRVVVVKLYNSQLSWHANFQPRYLQF